MQPNTHASALSRRSFLSLAPAVLAAPTLLAAARRAQASAPRLDDAPRIAVVGCGGRGADNLGDLLGAGANVVAVCDVDENHRNAGAARAAGARTFADMRDMLARRAELRLEGVLVSTPDHTHAFATALALRAGLAAYCEKPLTHTIHESRRIGELAAAARTPTQMGTQIHATENYRRVVELIRAGAIGRVTSCDCWVNKGWCCGPTGPVVPAPATLGYDLWLGPAQESPYIENLHPANWRKYWAFGTGTLGDMGCHMLDLPVWALGLTRDALTTAEVRAECTKVDSVACPEWTEASWAFPQPGGDPLVLRWFDNGRVSPTAQELGAKDRADYHGRFNMVFQGTKGFLWANYGEHLITPAAVAAESTPALVRPEHRIAPSPGHHREWLDAIRTHRDGKDAADAPLCAFARATVLNEIVLSGTVAARAQRALEYDFRTREFTGGDPIPTWNPAPRAGWSLDDADLDRVLRG